MIEYETQLKLQAFLDGELPEDEARTIAARVAQDPEATDLLAELRNTRQALSLFEEGPKLPESREFYWSKIQRAIERLEPAPATVPERSSRFAFFRRLLLPAGSVAALVVAGIIVAHQFNPVSSMATEAALADTGAVTYRDQSEGMTVVWLSYPAEK